MKNFRILKYVLLFAIFSVFSGCVKDKIIPEETILTTSSDLDINTDLEFFLSNEKTYNLLSSSAFNWKKDPNQVASRNEETDELKAIVIDVNTHLSDKYVTHLINKVGYPLWDASVLELLDDGGYVLITPVFKVGSNKINALFTYTLTGNGKVGYDLVTREEMESNSIQLKDPNFKARANFFKFYDKLLFNYEPPIYEDWIELELNEIECYVSSGFQISSDFSGIGYVSCSEGCFDELSIAGILDTPEEQMWARENCNYVDAVNTFLKTSDLDYKNGFSSFTGC